MDTFLETYNLPEMNQEKRIWTITSNEIESVVKKFSINKSPGPDGYITEFYQSFKEELISTFLKSFQNIEEKGKLPNSFYEVSVTLIAKPDKDTTKQENYRPIALKNTKILNNILPNQI